MKVVSINTGKPIEEDNLQIRKPKAPSDFSITQKGDKVILSREHYEFIKDMETFYADLYLSALSSIRNQAVKINRLQSI